MKINAISDTKSQTATSGLAWDEIRYVYDVLGRRLAKIVTENGNFKRATRFIYDGWNVVEERTERQGAAGVVVRNFVWGEDLSGSLQGAGGVGGLVTHMEKTDSTSWTPFYYHYDGNGNVTNVTNPTKSSVAKFTYDAFGRTVSQSGSKAGIDINALSYRFSTKPMELELATANTTLVPPPVSSGLYYYGYRFYSPNLGRWISRDPIREKGGRNLYNFVGNDGVLLIDPLGQWSWTQTFGVVQAIGGAAEVVVGAITAAGAGWTGVGAVAGVALAAHGVDDFQAGIRTAISGESVQNFTQQGVSSALQSAGVSQENADLAAAGTDFGLSLGLNTASALSNAQRLAQRLAQLERARELEEVARRAAQGCIKDAAVESGEITVIGRVRDLQQLNEGERSLLSRLPDLGSPRENWRQNSGVLRQEMNRGLPIRDASVGDTGGQFLNAERYLL